MKSYKDLVTSLKPAEVQEETHSELARQASSKYRTAIARGDSVGAGQANAERLRHKRAAAAEKGKPHTPGVDESVQLSEAKVTDLEDYFDKIEMKGGEPKAKPRAKVEKSEPEITGSQIKFFNNFKEDVDLNEKMDMAKSDMGDVITDFQKSDAPQFAGKSKEKRKQMAIAAKLEADRKQQNEAKDTVVRDKTGKLISFKHEGDWKKADPKKNPEGKVHNLAGQALKKAQGLTKEETELQESAAKVETKKYSWGTMKTIHKGASYSIPLHPEHHEHIAKMKDGHVHDIKTEDGRQWHVKREGDTVHFHGANGGPKTSVPHSALKEEVELQEGFVVHYHDEKGQHKNTSKVFDDKAKADAHAAKGNSIDKVGGKYSVHKIDSEGRSVKEELIIDEEGNLMAEKKSYADFMSQLVEYKSDDSGVYRHKGTYGSAYKDPEGADDADDKPKKSAGRQAGSKVGPKKNLGNSKLHTK
jgi:hypothetical protein